MIFDPIAQALAVRVQRVLVFFLITVVSWIGAFWGVSWIIGLSSPGEVWNLWRMSWPPAGNLTLELIFGGTGIIGLLSTVVVYQALALWWQQRGAVHQRGARFIDQRGSQR
jgi:hypothetical protein